MKRILIGLVSLSLLAGCASGRCKGELDYQKAYSLPEAKVAGLKQTTPAGAMVVPPAPGQIVPYGQLVQEPGSSKPRLECLDTPPAKS